MPDVLAGFSAAALGETAPGEGSEDGPTPGQAGVGGPVLVRHDDAPANPRAVMLHVHGYNDYFFHEHAARDAAERGYAFYAVDLRRAGRALRPEDHPHDMATIAEPGEDISAAADAIAVLHPGLPLVVNAHSTGGLSALIWAKDHVPANLAAVIANSPLLGRVLTRSQKIRMPALPVIARTAPRMVVSHTPSVYAKHLHVSGGGEWEFDTTWKRPAGVPVRAQWLSSVTRSQKRIARGLGLELPVLVARSDSTGPESDDNPNLRTQDIVVDVDAIARLTPHIGPHVTELVIPGALHDLSLAAPAQREAYRDAMFAWLAEVLVDVRA